MPRNQPLPLQLAQHSLTLLLGNQYHKLLQRIECLQNERLLPALIKDTHTENLTSLILMYYHYTCDSLPLQQAIQQVFLTCHPSYRLAQAPSPLDALQTAMGVLEKGTTAIQNSQWRMGKLAIEKYLRSLKLEYQRVLPDFKAFVDNPALHQQYQQRVSLAVLGAGYYQLDIADARKLLCINALGGEIRTNSSGAHAVVAANGAHYKPNPVACNASGELPSTIKPGREYAVSALLQLIAGDALTAAPSTLISVDYYINNPENEQQSTAQLQNLVQAGLTIDGLCLKEYLMLRHTLSLWQQRLSPAALENLLADCRENQEKSNLLGALTVVEQYYPALAAINTSSRCYLEIIFNEPTDSDKTQVIQLQKYLLICRNERIFIGFCHQEGSYHERSIQTLSDCGAQLQQTFKAAITRQISTCIHDEEKIILIEEAILSQPRQQALNIRFSALNNEAKQRIVQMKTVSLICSNKSIVLAFYNREQEYQEKSIDDLGSYSHELREAFATELFNKQNTTIYDQHKLQLVENALAQDCYPPSLHIIFSGITDELIKQTLQRKIYLLICREETLVIGYCNSNEEYQEKDIATLFDQGHHLRTQFEKELIQKTDSVISKSDKLAIIHDIITNCTQPHVLHYLGITQLSQFSEALRLAFEKLCENISDEQKLIDFIGFASKSETARAGIFKETISACLRLGGVSLHLLKTALGVCHQYPALMEGQTLNQFIEQLRPSKYLFTLFPNEPLATTIEEAQQLLTEKYLDPKCLSALWLGLLLSLPNDAKFDNFMLQLDHNKATHKVVACRIVGIDNDLSLNMPFSLNEEGSIGLEIKNTLITLPELMAQPIHPHIRRRFLTHSAYSQWFTWLSILAKREVDYHAWIAQGTISVHKLRAVDIPVMFSHEILYFVLQQWQALHDLLTNNENITHGECLKSLYPAVYAAYEALQREASTPLECEYQLYQKFKVSGCCPLESLLDDKTLYRRDNELYNNALAQCSGKFAKQTLAAVFKRPSSSMTIEQRKQHIATQTTLLEKPVTASGFCEEIIVAFDWQAFSQGESKHQEQWAIIQAIALLPNNALEMLQQSCYPPLNWQDWLQEAVCRGNPLVAQKMLSLGASVSACDEITQQTPLHTLSRHYLTYPNSMTVALMAEVLLTHYSCQPNAYNQQGYTPLLQWIKSTLDITKLSEEEIQSAEILLSQLIVNGADIEAKDIAKNETALDKTLNPNHLKPQWFMRLTGLGAGMHSNAVLIMNYLKKSRPLLNDNLALKNAFDVLAQRNLDFCWLLSLSILEPEPSEAAHTRIVGVELGTMYLPQIIQQTILTAEQTFNEKSETKTEHGRRVVQAISYHETNWHIKEYPEMPGIELSVGLFGRMLFGIHTAPGQLFSFFDKKAQSYPVLISQTVPGDNLHDVLMQITPALLPLQQPHSPQESFLTSPREREQALEKISRLHPQYTSEQIVLAMLIHPEDGKPDNYQLSAINPSHHNPRYRLIGVDNDHAFVKALLESTDGKRELQVKCVLFCLEEMRSPVHPRVRQRILALSPEPFLEEWLTHLQEYQTHASELFHENDQNRFYKGVSQLLALFTFQRKQLPVAIKIPFPKHIITALLERFKQLQHYLRKEPTITHLKLLSKISPLVGLRYEETFQNYGDPDQVLPRFHHLFEQSYSVAMAGRYQTLTTTKDMVKKMGGSEEQQANPHDKKNSDELSPSAALKELKQAKIQQQWQQYYHEQLLSGNISVLAELKLPGMQQALINQLDFSEITLSNSKEPDVFKQKEILNFLLCEKIAFKTLYIKGCVALTDLIFTQLLAQSSELKSLKLIDCPNISDVSIKALVNANPPLKSLMLQRLPLITAIGHITDSTIFGRKITLVNWQTVRKLNIRENANLQHIAIQCSQCTHVILAHNPNLTYVELRSQDLVVLNISDCQKITNTQLENITQYCSLMPLLQLKNTNVINPVIQAFNRYAPHLFSLFKPKECFTLIPENDWDLFSKFFNQTILKQIEIAWQFYLQKHKENKPYLAEINNATRDYLLKLFSLFQDFYRTLLKKLDPELVIAYYNLISSLNIITSSDITIAPLLEALKDKDLNIRVSATKVINEMNITRTNITNALMAALKEDDWWVRTRAVEFLGNLDKDEATQDGVIKVLVEALKDKDWNVRARVAEALGKLGSVPNIVINALVATLQDNNWKVCMHTAEALGKLGVTKDDVIQALLVALKEVDMGVSASAAAALVNLGKIEIARDGIIKALVAALKNSISNVRIHAAEALSKLDIDQNVVIKTLVMELKENDWNDCYRVAVVLLNLVKVETARDDVIAALIAALKNKADPCARAAWALGKLGIARDDVIQALVPALEEHNFAIRCNATWALGNLGIARYDVIQALVAVLAHGRGVSAYAVEALVHLRKAEATQNDIIQALVTALKYKDINVRANAAEALGKLGIARDDVIQALIVAMEADDWHIRANAADALGNLGIALDHIIQALVATLKKENDWRVRTSAAGALANLEKIEIARDDVIQTLVTALKKEENEWEVHSRAIKALGKVGIAQKDVINALVAVLRDKYFHNFTRAHAAQALTNLLKTLSGDDKIVNSLPKFLIYQFEWVSQKYRKKNYSLFNVEHFSFLATSFRTTLTNQHSSLPFFQPQQNIQHFSSIDDEQGKTILEFIIALSEIEYNQEISEGKRQFFGLITLADFNYTPGNCLFAAIAIALNSETEITLRQKTVQYLAQDKQLQKRILTGIGEEKLITAIGNKVYTSFNTPNDPTSYINLMAQNLTWGTYIEVIAIVRLLKRPIVILTPYNRFDQIIAEPEYQDSQPIFLNYINKNHFEPLIVPEYARSATILAEIKKAINEQKTKILFSNTSRTSSI